MRAAWLWTQIVVDLYQNKQTGIFAQLQEACLYPRPNDRTFLTKLNSLHARCGPALLQCRVVLRRLSGTTVRGKGSCERRWFLCAVESRRNAAYGTKSTKPDTTLFSIQHSVEHVSYAVDGFIQKNKDRLPMV